MWYLWATIAVVAVVGGVVGYHLRKKAGKGKGPDDIYPFW